MTQPDGTDDAGRNETFVERMDRNWDELVATGNSFARAGLVVLAAVIADSPRTQGSRRPRPARRDRPEPRPSAPGPGPDRSRRTTRGGNHG